jgi:hypothetical protein
MTTDTRDLQLEKAACDTVTKEEFDERSSWHKDGCTIRKGPPLYLHKRQWKNHGGERRTAGKGLFSHNLEMCWKLHGLQDCAIVKGFLGNLNEVGSNAST